LERAALEDRRQVSEFWRDFRDNEIPPALELACRRKHKLAVTTSDPGNAGATGVADSDLDPGLWLINTGAVIAVAIDVAVDDDRQCVVGGFGACRDRERHHRDQCDADECEKSRQDGG
jgi:hypothetical protein